MPTASVMAQTSETQESWQDEARFSGKSPESGLEAPLLQIASTTPAWRSLLAEHKGLDRADPVDGFTIRSRATA